MTRSFFFCLACGVALSSCDKAKSIAVRAKDVVAEQIERVNSNFEGKPQVDSDLNALVDQTEEGYLFRKDLPFPPKVNAKETSEQRIKAHVFRASLLGRSNVQLDGLFRQETDIERNDAKVTLELRKEPFLPLKTDEEKKAAKLKAEGEKAKIAGIRGDAELRGKKWVSVSPSSIGHGEVERRLMETGALPRPFWFGKGRLKKGDRVSLTGEHLKMLLFKEGSGSIDLTFEGVEAVHGHPCGVFSVTGDVTDPDFVVLDEWTGPCDLTIQSGKLWLSLVYPVVLKEDYEAILSAKAGDGDSVTASIQGTFGIKNERDWSAGK